MGLSKALLTDQEQAVPTRRDAARHKLAALLEVAVTDS